MTGLIYRMRLTYTLLRIIALYGFVRPHSSQ